jgi:hypothetical protein
MTPLEEFETYRLKYVPCTKQQLWYNISRKENLSEDFINKYSKKLDWFCILARREFSEEFILNHIKYFNVLDWMLLSLTHKLSLSFIKQNLSIMKLDNIINNKRYSEEELEAIKEIYFEYGDLV